MESIHPKYGKVSMPVCISNVLGQGFNSKMTLATWMGSSGHLSLISLVVLATNLWRTRREVVDLRLMISFTCQNCVMGCASGPARSMQCTNLFMEMSVRFGRQCHSPRISHAPGYPSTTPCHSLCVSLSPNLRQLASSHERGRRAGSDH